MFCLNSLLRFLVTKSITKKGVKFTETAEANSFTTAGETTGVALRDKGGGEQ